MLCPECGEGVLIAQETRTGWGDLVDDGCEVWTEDSTWVEDTRLILAVQCPQCDWARDFPDGASAEEVYALYPQGRLLVPMIRLRGADLQPGETFRILRHRIEPASASLASASLTTEDGNEVERVEARFEEGTILALFLDEFELVEGTDG